MFKKLCVVMAMLAASVSFAATDVNKATAAELDSVKGIGPSMSAKILKERQKGNFKNWADLEQRVAGIKDKRAMALSNAGLTVDGSAFSGAAAPAEKAKASKGH